MNEQERELVSLVIGYQIRNSRQSHSLSQSDLAQGIGSQSMISLLESGRQFPLPDVLSLIAERLEDATLRSYTSFLSSGNWSLVDFTSMNREILVEVLRSHRGKWHDIHLKIAIQLCDHFYDSNIFRIVCEICQLILSHTDDSPSLARAYFYLGSTDLYLNRYEKAECWLREADKLSEVLDEQLRARLYYNLGYVYSILDHPGLGMWYAKLAVDAFHLTHDFQRYAKTLGLLGVIQSRLGRLEDARETLHFACELCEKWDIHEADRARIHITMADVCESLKEFDYAEVWSERAIECSSQSADLISLSAAYRILCLVSLSRRNTDQAITYIHSSIEAAEQSQDGWSLSHAYLLATGVFPTHEERIQAAILAFNAAQNSNYKAVQALASECLANLLAEQNPKAANEYSSMATHLYRAHLEKSSMLSSGLKYLPINWSYDS